MGAQSFSCAPNSFGYAKIISIVFVLFVENSLFGIRKVSETMIRIIEVTSVEALVEYRDCWKNLLPCSETDTVFLTYEWVLSCWQSLGGDDRLMVLVAEENSQVIGIAPLALTTHRSLWKSLRTIEFVSSIHADYNDIIAAKDTKERVLRALFSYLISIRNRWDVIKLNEIPGESSTIEFCKKVGTEYFKFCKIREASICPKLITQGHEDEIGKKILRRKDFKYRYNWLNRQGDLVYHNCQSTEEIMSLLNTYFNYHIGRWEPTETKSLFYDPLNREFYRLLVKNMFPTGCLKFSVLSLDGLILAFCFGFEYNRTIIRYKSTFNNAFRKHSPGLVLLKFAIEEALERGLRGIDYVRGAEAYKSFISNSHTRNKGVYLYNNKRSCFFSELVEKFRGARLWNWLRGKKNFWRYTRILRRYVTQYHLRFGFKIAQRLLVGIFVFCRSYLFSTMEPGDKTFTTKLPFEIRKVAVADIWLVASLYGCAEDSPQRKMIEQAFENGDECFVAFEGRNVAHCSWVRKGQSIGIGLDEAYSLQLAENQACIHSCRTSVVYQDTNVYPAVLEHIQKHCFEQGVQKVYVWCGVLDTYSTTNIQKAGFSPEKIIRVTRFFSHWHICRASDHKQIEK